MSVVGSYYRRKAPVHQTPAWPFRLNREHPLAKNLHCAFLLSDGISAPTALTIDERGYGRNLVTHGRDPQIQVLVSTTSTSSASKRGLTPLPWGTGFYHNKFGAFTQLRLGTGSTVDRRGWLETMAGNPLTGETSLDVGGDVRGSIHLMYWGQANDDNEKQLLHDGTGNSLLVWHDFVAQRLRVSGIGIPNTAFDLPAGLGGDDRPHWLTLSFNKFGVSDSFFLFNGHRVSMGARGGISFHGEQKRVGAQFRGGAFFVACWSDRNLSDVEAYQLQDPGKPWPLIEQYGRRTYFVDEVEPSGLVSSSPTAWRVLTTESSPTAWHVLAERATATAWQVFALTGSATAWRVRTQRATATAWRILLGQITATATAWRVLRAQSSPTAWRLRIELGTPTAWRVRVQHATATAWRVIATTFTATSTAWQVLADRSSSTAWRLRNASSSSSAWRILAELASPTAWRVRLASSSSTAWRVLRAHTSATAWRILSATVNTSVVAWRILSEHTTASAWRIRAERATSTAWAILAPMVTSSATAWRVFNHYPTTVAWRVRLERATSAAWRLLNARATATGWRIGLVNKSPAFVIYAHPRHRTIEATTR